MTMTSWKRDQMDQKVTESEFQELRTRLYSPGMSQDLLQDKIHNGTIESTTITIFISTINSHEMKWKKCDKRE